MISQPSSHHRKSVRLKEFDYSQPGAYFITIVTKNRQSLFGKVINGKVQLNPIGLIVQEEWLSTPRIRQDVELGEWIIMPNHLHGIIILKDIVGARSPVPLPDPYQIERFGKPTSGSIPTIIRSIKATTTKRINLYRTTPGQEVWQRGFFEHVIKNDQDYQNHATYILTNPERFGIDKD